MQSERPYVYKHNYYYRTKQLYMLLRDQLRNQLRNYLRNDDDLQKVTVLASLEETESRDVWVDHAQVERREHAVMCQQMRNSESIKSLLLSAAERDEHGTVDSLVLHAVDCSVRSVGITLSSGISRGIKREKANNHDGHPREYMDLQCCC